MLSMKLDLLTNATVVDDAIRFVSSNKSKEKTLPDNNEDEKGSKEATTSNEDEHPLKRNQEEIAEAAITTNQVF